MNTIILAMPESKDSYDELCRDLSSGGNIVILTQLHNEYEINDFLCDILRISFVCCNATSNANPTAGAKDFFSSSPSSSFFPGVPLLIES